MTIDFHKAAAILLRDRKILVTREKGKNHFIAPGGVIEKDEQPKDTVVRELKEEVNLTIEPDSLTEFGTFFAVAAGTEDKQVQMDVFMVESWRGEPVASSGEEEIEEIAWINSQIPEGMKVGSIFEHEVIPLLKERGLID